MEDKKIISYLKKYFYKHFTAILIKNYYILKY